MVGPVTAVAFVIFIAAVAIGLRYVREHHFLLFLLDHSHTVPNPFRTAV